MAETEPEARNGHGTSEPVQESTDICSELLLSIQRGDERAFEELYRQRGSILLATILRIVRNRSLAEEVLQEVFTEVWIHSGRFRVEAGTGRAWLTTLCRRRAIDRVRAVQAQQDRDLKEGVHAAEGTEPSIEREALNRVEAARVATALRRLPVEQASAIAMAYYQELSHSEIAAALGVPLGTIKSRIRDGMTRLRAHLGVANGR